MGNTPNKAKQDRTDGRQDVTHSETLDLETEEQSKVEHGVKPSLGMKTHVLDRRNETYHES